MGQVQSFANRIPWPAGIGALALLMDFDDGKGIFGFIGGRLLNRFARPVNRLMHMPQEGDVDRDFFGRGWRRAEA
jgi:hypothetical protein